MDEITAKYLKKYRGHEVTVILSGVGNALPSKIVGTIKDFDEKVVILTTKDFGTSNPVDVILFYDNCAAIIPANIVKK